MIHVHPINDLKEHVLEGTTCHCEPRIDYDGPEMLVIHNSYDRRELREPFSDSKHLSEIGNKWWRGDHE